MSRSRGSTRLDLVIVLCLVGILTSFAAQRLWALRFDAEHAAFTHVVATLQRGVAMEMLARIARNQDGELERLADSNPMRLMLHPPGNYLGDLAAPDPCDVPAGHWYFDSTNRLLVYRIHYADHFVTELPEPARARFRIGLVYAQERLAGARLDPAEPFSWRISGPGGGSIGEREMHE